MNELFKIAGKIALDIAPVIKDLTTVTKEAEETEGAISRLDLTAQELGQNMAVTGEVLSSTSDTLSQFTADVTNASTSAANDFDNSMTSMQTNIAVTAEELEYLTDVGSDLYEEGFQDSIKYTTEDLEEFETQTEDAGDALDGSDGLTKKTENAGNKFKELSGKLETVGGALTKYVTAPLTALGGIGVASAVQFDDAMVTVQNGLGMTDEEAQQLTETAQNIYKKGFEGSLGDITNDLVTIKQNLGDLVADNELQQVTEDAKVLAQTMGEDVGWITRAVNAMNKEFGTSVKESLDLLAWGQQNGLNYSNELADNVAEYSSDFAKLGYTAEEYFAIMKNGQEDGAYTMDRVNDVMREFHNNMIIDTKNADEAMEMMSGSTQALWAAYKDGHGDVRDVLDAVTDDLARMDGQLQQDAGMKVFRIMWEEMNTEMLLNLGEVNEELENVDGTMQGMTETAEEAFSTKLSSFMRDAKEQLLPLGEELLEIATTVLPPIIEGLTILSKLFEGMPDWMQTAIVAFGGIAAVLGPVLLGISGLVKFIGPLFAEGSLLSGLLGKLGAGFGLLKAAIIPLVTAAAPFIAKAAAIVAAVLAVIGVIKGVIWIFENFGEAIWDFTKGAFNAVVDFLKEIANPLGLLPGLFKFAIDKIVDLFGFEFEWPDLLEPAKRAWEGVKDFFSSGIDWIKGLFDFDFDWPSFGGGGSGGSRGGGVSWNAEGGIFTEPTIFNTPKGLQGVGEAGAEAIIPLNEASFSSIAKGITRHLEVPQEQNDMSVMQAMFNEFIKEQRLTREAIARMKVEMDGRKVGNLVTPQVDGNLGKRQKLNNNRFR